MSEDLSRAYGVGAQAMLTMSKLTKQIKAKGGEEEDVRLLENNDHVLENVARLLARAGRLLRPFSVNMDKGLEDIFFIGLKIETVAGICLEILPGGQDDWKVCRFATLDELRGLYDQYPGALQDEPDVMIIGEKIPFSSSSFAVLTHEGADQMYFNFNHPLQKNWWFAVVFTK